MIFCTVFHADLLLNVKQVVGHSSFETPYSLAKFCCLHQIEDRKQNKTSTVRCIKMMCTFITVPAGSMVFLCVRMIL